MKKPKVKKDISNQDVNLRYDLAVGKIEQSLNSTERIINNEALKLSGLTDKFKFNEPNSELLLKHLDKLKEFQRELAILFREEFIDKR